ncbi:MAG TPA: hypothetical protein VI391_07270, partial [Thermoanaerobaculia bacterium]
DADTAAWVATDEKLATEYPKATFVPGHGEVGNAQDVGAFREYLQTLRSDVSSARQRNLTGDALSQAVRADLAPKYEKWGFYSHFVDPNIRQMDEELAGTKRRPAISR